MDQTPPTPPPTQIPEQPDEPEMMPTIGPTRHPKFYCISPTLTDGIVIQAQNTLYRLSFHGLARGSHFFASVFSINNGDLKEGSSDECPIILPESITSDAFEAYLWYDTKYEENPSQEYLINAISISRSWSIQHLFGYAFDHFRRQFFLGQIHPAVVLGVARKNGIPDLIEPAVKALAKPSIPLASWCTSPGILHHVTLEDICKISRMKEKLWTARTALCKVPPIVHDLASCLQDHRNICSGSWRQFWLLEVVPRLLELNDELDSRLVWIGTDLVAKAKVEGMARLCLANTVQKVVANAGWRAEIWIPEGAVESLMVPERMMLAPDSE
ncbi:hypothetical protein BDM02DRAFT_3192807 [Thelephora ganbajun]|uniref:Uncharacterized protein n=1 Tax=Thelephora ganbajun TaxID=370292 RepID=A0ACB6YZQ8_THEGA|nr:hypothetical protein BDM02DRAFT_3192807 [Thelephora ganbajun]